MTDTKKKILLIGTGGTIACKQSDSGLIPVLTAEELLSHVPEVREFCQVTSLQLCNIDSTDVTPSHWLEFARAIKENYDDNDGFLICHGTDTLAYTAAALSYLIQNSSKPIVITGAQKPIDSMDTDARRNLRDSLIYASDDRSCNVTIVFDGKVIAGTRAKKERSKSYDAFSSINYPNLAVVRDGRVIRYIDDKPEMVSEVATGGAVFNRVSFASGVSDRVFILKLTPGMSGDILPNLFAKYECIIVESFGVGGIPTYLMENFRQEMETHNTLVIMATQVAEEGSDMSVYQVGHDVKYDFDLLETYDMTLEAAYAKACWLLGREEAADHAAIKDLFYTPVNHDITCN